MTAMTPVAYRDVAQAAPHRLLMVGNFLNASVKTRTASEELADHLSARGVGVLTTSSRTNRVARLADMVWTVWKRRHEYSVAQVAVFSGPAFIWAEVVCAALRLIGKPYVLTLHGGNLPQFARTSGKRVAKLLQSAAAVTAPSRYLQEQLEGYRPGIRLVPNSLDIVNYPYRHRTQARPKLVWLRAFHKIYNPSMAVEVVERLARRFPELELVMVGREKDGSLAVAQQLVRDKGLDRQITFTGGISKEEVPAVLASADIFLNTASTDNTPVSVLEAMACGLCVVSTDAGGLPYLLDNGVDALVSPVENPDRMAEAVERLLTDPGLAGRLSEAGRRKVEPFDSSAVADGWTSLLVAVAGGKRL